MQRSTTSYSNQDSSYKSFQPKFKECVFDSDKDPKYFRLWVRLLSGIIRNIPGGAALENFLDHYLKRDIYTSSTRPSFLEDEDLDLGDHGPELRPQVSSSTDDDDEISTFRMDPTLYPRKYKDLLETSVELDVLLFHTLFTIVKGSYLALITDLNGHYGRYSFAIITMWKHANLQSANRRIEAMSAMQELHYHGDAGKWKIDFLSRAREVYASHASIEHYIMQCAFNSFEGKCQPLQAKITEDINNDDLVGEGMNLEALASKYGAFLATLNAQKNSRMVGINSATKNESEKWCEYCKSKTHDTRDCRTKGKTKGRCHYCNRKGHMKPNCPLKAKHDEEKAKADQEEESEGEKSADEEESPPEKETSPIKPVDKKVNAAQKKTSRISNAQVSDTAIADLMKKLKSGEIKLAM